MSEPYRCAKYRFVNGWNWKVFGKIPFVVTELIFQIHEHSLNYVQLRISVTRKSSQTREQTIANLKLETAYRPNGS